MIVAAAAQADAMKSGEVWEVRLLVATFKMHQNPSGSNSWATRRADVRASEVFDQVDEPRHDMFKVNSE